MDLVAQRDSSTGRFLPGNCLASAHAYYHDPAVLEAAVDDYFDVCEDKDVSPVITGLALHLGFADRYSLADYLHRPGRQPFALSIKRAKSRIEAYRVQRMVDGKGNVIGAIFDLKNNFGYVDKQVTESEVKISQTFDAQDREDLKALALQMIEEREGAARLSAPSIEAEYSEQLTTPEMVNSNNG